MDRIFFDNVLPQVFAQSGDLHSDVWQKQTAFEKGHLYLLEADSGRGKSTFCSYVLGYRNDYSGTINFDNADITRLSINAWVKIRQAHIANLFQEMRLFTELTALENVEIKNRLTGYKTRTKIDEWFDRLAIADKKDVKVAQLSYGQQQRVAMMRALVQPFDFLLADEPISHLDDTNAHAMGEIMLEEAQAQGAGVIVTSIGKHMPLTYERTLRL